LPFAGFVSVDSRSDLRQGGGFPTGVASTFVFRLDENRF
jgi:hypothetical protein